MLQRCPFLFSRMYYILSIVSFLEAVSTLVYILTDPTLQTEGSEWSVQLIQ